MKDNRDLKRLVIVLETLSKHPEGLWLRRLAQETHIPISTLHRYIEGKLAPFIENIGVRNDEGRFFGVRVVRLREGAQKRLLEGVSPTRLLQESRVLRG